MLHFSFSIENNLVNTIAKTILLVLIISKPYINSQMNARIWFSTFRIDWNKSNTNVQLPRLNIPEIFFISQGPHLQPIFTLLDNCIEIPNLK